MKLVHGNCIDFLKTLPDQSIDNIFADLPYGNGTEYNSYEDTEENLAKLVNEFMPEALRVAKRIAITPGTGNITLYPKSTWTLAWVNEAGNSRCWWGFMCWQPILVYGKDPYLATGRGCRPDTFIQHANQKEQDNNEKIGNHPCPKPVSVMRWIIERTTNKGEMVLDPFMGSGTTGVACVQLGREFIGCELDEEYFNIASKRLSNLQQPLFT